MNGLKTKTSRKLPGTLSPYVLPFFPKTWDKEGISHTKNHWLLVILPVLGISFWFLLGFPLADRNESYIWITYLQKYSFVEIIQNPIPSIRNFRPLAQAVTWCLYHLSGGNGILVQAINFILLCAATWIMISLTQVSKLLYAQLFYLMIGFIYFSSFYYIFNLHGIFYSVVLLMIALFLKTQEGVLTNWKKWFLICFILAFFHPLILLFYVAYLIGWLIEIQQIDTSKIVLLAFILGGLFVLLEILLPFPIFSVIEIQNLVGTMRNVESHVILKIFTLLLCSLTFLNKARQQQLLFLAGAVIYLPLAAIYDLPVLLLLGFLILLSLVIERKWSLASLVVAAISFPLTVGSGAPTKASIFIFLLPYLLLRPLSFSFAVKDWLPKAIAFATIASIIFCLVLIRLEIKMPVISSLINPILVEKGKTYQLEKALVIAQEQIPPRRIQFLQEKQSNIRDKGQPKQRDNFPPTRQNELDAYQYYTTSPHAWNTLPTWYMAFGTELPGDTLMLVHILQEKNCKPAYIYEAVRPKNNLRGIISSGLTATYNVRPISTGLSNPKVQFYETFEGSKPFSQAYNIETGDWDYALQYVPSPVYRGEKSARFEIKNDQPLVKNGKRSEVTIIKGLPGKKMWYSFAVYFPTDGFVRDSQREVINQWYQDGSPATSLRVRHDRIFLETGSEKENRKQIDIGLLTKDTWHEFVFHFIHSHGGDGLVEVWHNGKKVITHEGGNMYNDVLPKWKIGVYKAAFKFGTSDVTKRVIYFDNIKVGNERASYIDMAPGQDL